MLNKESILDFRSLEVIIVWRLFESTPSSFNFGSITATRAKMLSRFQHPIL